VIARKGFLQIYPASHLDGPHLFAVSFRILESAYRRVGSLGEEVHEVYAFPDAVDVEVDGEVAKSGHGLFRHAAHPVVVIQRAGGIGFRHGAGNRSVGKQRGGRLFLRVDRHVGHNGAPFRPFASARSVAAAFAVWAGGEHFRNDIRFAVLERFGRGLGGLRHGSDEGDGENCAVDFHGGGSLINVEGNLFLPCAKGYQGALRKMMGFAWIIHHDPGNS
jgi:hypothetical protein